MNLERASMDDAGGCKPCAFENAGVPGGWFLQDEHWSVGVYPTFEVPGWVVVQLRRHALGLDEMTADELTSLGPMLARVTRAIVAETKAERVYLLSFGEAVRHVHVLLMPRGPAVPSEHRGAALYANSKLYGDTVAAAETSARLCAILRSDQPAAAG